MEQIFEVLNKLKYTEKLGNSEVVILHRGAPGDKKTISGGNITKIKRTYFMYKNNEETFIPMHRVLEVKIKGKTIWKKKTRS